MSLGSRDGRAGSGPAGPAGVTPYRFTDKEVPCECTVCPECACSSVHVTRVCACCRAGLHDGSCGNLPTVVEVSTS